MVSYLRKEICMAEWYDMEQPRNRSIWEQKQNNQIVLNVCNTGLTSGYLKLNPASYSVLERRFRGRNLEVLICQNPN